MGQLRALRASHNRVREMLAEVKYELAWRRFVRKYSPDQPRVPAGNPDGGQWTDGGGGQGDSDSATSDASEFVGEGSTDDPPDIPEERPPTAGERRIFLKEIVRWLATWGGDLVRVVGPAYWLYEYQREIEASLDPPKTLDELRRAADEQKAGYQRHHIVEQGPARQEGYPESVIDSPENLVRIPTLKHRDITAWYQTKNEDFGGESPRDYLRGKSWDERMRVGSDALVRYGVLKP